MIIISDIHGCYKTFNALLAKLPKDKICIAGDLIDRGPDSCQVINRIIEEGFDCIQGNHEEFMYEPYMYKSWMVNGGEETERSYSLKYDDFLKHCDWLRELPLYKHYPDIKDHLDRSLLVTHSQAPDWWWKDRDQSMNPIDKAHWKGTILWNRDFIGTRTPTGIFNVFGHTPQKNGPRLKYDYACIDTGCVFKEPGYGVLTALQFPEMQVFTQENIDL